MNVFDLFATLSLDSSEYDKGLDKAKEKSGGVGSALKTAAAVGGAAITAASAAITAFAASSVKVGQAFDSSMSQVAATMGYTVEELNTEGSAAAETFKTLSAFAQEMGSTTAFSASQAADALNYMALAGYDAETSMKMLPNVLNLAAAGGIELAAASDMVTDASSALGLNLEQTAELVDKMAKASSKSNTSVAQLGDAILTVGGTAKNLAGGTTELSTALGILADNGIKGAEGGTSLRNIILALSAPTDAAAKKLKELGVQVYDDAGNMRALDDVFGDLSGSLSKLTQGQQTEALNIIFNKVDLKSANALLATGAERWEELAGAIDNADGAAAAMAKVQLDNLAGDITLFQSALEGAKIAVSDGLTPTLRGFVQFGSSALSTLTEAFKAGGLQGAMSALGTLLSEGLNMVIGMLPELIKAGTGLVTALVKGIFDNLPMLLDAATTIILQLADDLVEDLPLMIPAIISMVLSIVEKLTDPDTLATLIDASVAIMIAIANGLVESLPTLIEKAPVIIANLVSAIVRNVPQLMTAAWEAIKTLAAGIIEYLPQIGEAAGEIIGTLLKGLADLWAKMYEVGSNIVQGVWEGIKNAGDWLWSQVTGFFSGIVDGVKNVLGIASPSKVFASIGDNMALGLGEGFEKTMQKVEADMFDAVPTSFDADIGVSSSVSASDSAGENSPITLVFNIIDELDGTVFAGKTFNYFVKEGDRRGTPITIGG